MKPVLSVIISLTLLSAAGVGLSSASISQVSLRGEGTVQDERGLVALDQALRDLTTSATVVCVSARPGDEDDGALAYLRKKFGARTVMLFATRGEGDDTAAAPERNNELGAVHTGETIEAARVLGSDVMFLNLRDPGYSKTAEDALRAWGRDDALNRFVGAYRSLRPDVIITRHDPRIGEGVEQVTARLALEAFGRAADAKTPSEAGSGPWQVQRIFRATREQEADDTSINLNEYDRVRGRTYAQIGLEAHHRFSSRGANLDHLTFDRQKANYKLIASTSDEKPKRGAGMLDGLSIPEKVGRSITPPRLGDQSIVDAAGSDDRLVDVLTQRLIEERAEGSLDQLRDRYGSQFTRVARFILGLERALVLALGLNLEAVLSDQTAVPGQKLFLRVVVRNGSARSFPVVLTTPRRLARKGEAPSYNESEVLGLGAWGVVTKEFEYEVAKDAPRTVPPSTHIYDEQYYSVGSSLPGAQPQRLIGNQVIVSAEVGVGQTSVHLAALVRFDVAPPVEIAAMPFAMLEDWSKPRGFKFKVRVRNRTPGALAGELWVVPLAVSHDEYEPLHLAFTEEDQELTVNLTLSLPILKPPLATGVLIEFRRERPTAPDPLGSARIAVSAADAAISDGLSVGYIPGRSNWLAAALEGLGLSPRELKLQELISIEHGEDINQTRPGCGDLSTLDAIIVDENCYAARPDLMLANRCLLRYARQGGTLVVLSQRPDDWNLALSGGQFSPYPIHLSRGRLTNESSRVKVLDAHHPLMTQPNEITSADFEGWTSERAVNIPSGWSREFSPLLETSDPGEDPRQGSLLVARYGEGTYIFASLSLRRQLVSGTPGAYRLFANLVSLSRTLKDASKPR